MEGNKSNSDKNRFIYTEEDMNSIIIYKNPINQNNSMSKLESLLLDVASNKIRLNELETTFDAIAVELLQNSKLVVGASEYLVKEIEFYLWSKLNDHIDPYVHKNSRQLEFGEWYFHRFKSIDTYDDNHKHKGLDLTFGSKEKHNYGGILIRAIKNIDNNNIINGPNKVAGEIITAILGQGITQTELIDTSVFNQNSFLRIIPFKSSENKLIKTKRYGLPNKNEDHYFNKEYRYFDYEYLKTLKGKEKIVEELFNNGKLTNEEAMRILGYKAKFLTNDSR